VSSFPKGFSLITNMVILENDSSAPEPCHTDVMETGKRRAKDMQLLVKTIVGKLES
jgi:purine-nucleoside phosphorylase